MHQTDPVWYIVRTATRQERRAEHSLREAGFSVYCPRLTRWERIGLRKLRDKRQAALFPGYLFCVIPDGEFLSVEKKAGVSSVLRCVNGQGERSPRSVPPSLVMALEMAEAAGQFDKTRQAEEETGLRVGQKVKVLVGAWFGHIATITALDAKGRVAVLHTLFGRDSAANYDVKQLEAVA